MQQAGKESKGAGRQTTLATQREERKPEKKCRPFGQALHIVKGFDESIFTILASKSVRNKIICKGQKY